jgi:formylglycine-generating enzyme required for sulfatase activity
MVRNVDPSQYKGFQWPVESVSWHDAQTFISLINLFGQHHYRLPSEAEWEYAARAGTTMARYLGGPGRGWLRLRENGRSEPKEAVPRLSAREL